MESVSSIIRDWWRSQRPLGSLLSFLDVSAQGEDASSVGTGTSSGIRGRMNVLVPPFDAPARKLSVQAATVILISVICTDVGVWQDMEKAVQTCGVLWTTIALLLGAFWTDRALQLLCAAVRRSGVISYAEVAWIAYSYGAELVVASLLHVYLLTVLVENLVDLRDVIQVIQSAFWEYWGSIRSSDTSIPTSSAVILLITLAAFAGPAISIQDVYRLRYFSYASLASLAITLVLLYILLATSLIVGPFGDGATNLDLTAFRDGGARPSSTLSALIALARIFLAYARGSVIVLPLHAPLKEPSNVRVVQMVRASVWPSFGILWLTAIGLYSLSLSLPNDDTERMDGIHPVSLLRIEQLFRGNTFLFCLAAFVQLMAALSVVLTSVVLLQPCRSNVLECIHRHYVNNASQEHGCCCEGSPNCDKLHESCPEECLKDDAETAQETVPSFTSQSTTPRMNNSFIPVISSAPVARHDYYHAPPLQVTVALSNTSASEITPLIYPSSQSSQSPSYQGSRGSSQQASSSSATNVNSIPSQLSSDEINQRELDIQRQVRVNFAAREETGETYEGSRRVCHIESNRIVRISSGITIWTLCYLVAVFCFDRNNLFHQAVSLTETIVEILISCVFPIAFLNKLRQRFRH